MMRMLWPVGSDRWAGALLLFGSWILGTAAIGLDVNDPASIKNAASTIAYGLMTYYTGNVTNTPDTIAVLPKPYYWWEAGALWGALLDYTHFTSDTTYLPLTTSSLLTQVGPAYDYIVPAHTYDEGNDDQSFWGFATMTSAEQDLPSPESPVSSWLTLTTNLWNSQVPHWDTASCGNGGLRWQIYPQNNGYNYKNSVSNGAFMQLAARLYRFTGNTTYLTWAEKVWDWERDVGLLTPDYRIYDGINLVGATGACGTISALQWSYNTGIHIYAAAILYNATTGADADLWRQRVQGLLDATSALFFTTSQDGSGTRVMFEVACETVHTCNTDQRSFKAYLARFLWATIKMAPWTEAQIRGLLVPSAVAAAKACSGPTDPVNPRNPAGSVCGLRWYAPGGQAYDGSAGVGEQLAALEVIQGLLGGGVDGPGRGGDLPPANPNPSASTTPLPSGTAASSTLSRKPSAATTPTPSDTSPTSVTSQESISATTATPTTATQKSRSEGQEAMMQTGTFLAMVIAIAAAVCIF